MNLNLIGPIITSFILKYFNYYSVKSLQFVIIITVITTIIESIIKVVILKEIDFKPGLFQELHLTNFNSSLILQLITAIINID